MLRTKRNNWKVLRKNGSKNRTKSDKKDLFSLRHRVLGNIKHSRDLVNIRKTFFMSIVDKVRGILRRFK